MKVLGQESPVTPVNIPAGLDSLVPPWVRDLTLVTIALLVAIAFARNWIYSARQAERLLEAERKVGDVQERNNEKLSESIDKLVEALDPVLKGNEAILKSVTEIQDEQRRYRENRGGGGRR